MFAVLGEGSRVCQKGPVTDQAAAVGGGKWGLAKATWRAAWNTEADLSSLMPLSSKRKEIEAYLGNCPTL